MRPSGSCWSKGKTRAARPSRSATKAFPSSTGNTSVSSEPRRGVTWSRRRAESSNPGGYGFRTERAARPPVLCSRRGIPTRIAHRIFRKARKGQRPSRFRPHRNLLPCSRSALSAFPGKIYGTGIRRRDSRYRRSPAPGKTPLSAKKISGGIRFSGECYFPRAGVGNGYGRCPRAGGAFPAGHVIHAACINIPSDIRYGSPALHNEKAIEEKDPA